MIRLSVIANEALHCPAFGGIQGEVKVDTTRALSRRDSRPTGTERARNDSLL